MEFRIRERLAAAARGVVDGLLRPPEPPTVVSSSNMGPSPLRQPPRNPDLADVIPLFGEPNEGAEDGFGFRPPRSSEAGSPALADHPSQDLQQGWMVKAAGSIGTALQTLRKAMTVQGPAREPQGHAYDPDAVWDHAGEWKERPSGVSAGTLRAMTYRCTPVAAIIQTRLNQVGLFGGPQTEPTGIGVIVMPKSKNEILNPTAATLRKTEELTEFFSLCGTRYGDRHLLRPHLEGVLRMAARDSLTYDQYALQVVPDRMGRPAEFVCMPGHSMRLASRPEDGGAWNFDPDDVHYIQVQRDLKVAEFNGREIIWGVRNPRSDLEVAGYGLSETELLIHTVTRMLWTEDYSARFFSAGSTVKGILNFKGFVSKAAMRAFRREWFNLLTGIHNCFAGSTVIVDKDAGALPIEQYLGEKLERPATLWTGTKWEKALVYRTGKKRLCRAKLGNGVTLETSPDQKFLVLGTEGPEWRRRHELKIGDVCCVNATPCENPDLKIPAYMGQEIDPDMMEVLGWALGDGSLMNTIREGKRVTQLQLYYHHEREEDLWRKHLKILQRFEPAAYARDRFVRGIEQETLKERHGFATVSDRRLTNHVNIRAFIDWLHELGFQSSADGKVIPPWLYIAPLQLRSAFLRGFFSADGNNAKLRHPAITICDARLRSQTRLLLLSMGIRTNLSEGKSKMGFAGVERTRVEAPSVLRITDRDLFFERVGFLQAHKQPIDLKCPREGGKTTPLPFETARHYGKLAREANKTVRTLNRGTVNQLNAIICGDDGCSVTRMRDFLTRVGLPEPEWFAEYHFEPVVELEETQDQVAMFDVSVYDDLHRVATNFVINSNSWKTPVTNAEDLQWISMHSSNRDMEFVEWLYYLLKCTAAVFQIDPMEINFHFGNIGQNMQVFETNNEAKTRMSQDRGLRPLVINLNASLQRIQDEIDPNFAVVLAGLDTKSEEQKMALAEQLTRSAWTIDEARERLWKMPPLPWGGGIVRSSEYITYMEQLAQLAAWETAATSGQSLPAGLGGPNPASPSTSRVAAA